MTTVAQQIIAQLRDDAEDVPTAGGLDRARAVNAELAANGRRLSFKERVALAFEHFPSLALLAVEDGDVEKAWLWALGSGDDNEIRVLAPILRDIMEYDQAVPGRSGPKPTVTDERRVHELFRQFIGQDHTTLPFHEAFALMRNGRSLRGLAAKIGLNYGKVNRLLKGAGPGSRPTRGDMERIAAAFRKHPSFFIEYRVLFLQDDLTRQLERLPEASIDLYQRIRSR